MAQPHSGDGEQKALSPEEKKRAILKLLLVIMVIDIILLVAYFYIVLVLGWDPVIAIIPLLGMSMVTGLYFGRQKRKIEKGS